MRKIISLGIFCSALCILLGLSYWQVVRLQWKSDIIDRLNIEYTKNPVKNQYSFKDLNLFEDEELPLKYGQLKGHLIYKDQILMGPKPHDGKIGYNVITPLKFKTGNHILVNRGWVDKDQTHKLQTKNKKQTVIISGIFRKPEWNSFTPNNSPENNIWTKLDIKGIAKAKNIKSISPVILYADNKTSEIITPQAKKWYPRNKHLQYAIFWFVMALTLSTIFGIFIRKNRQS